MSLQSVAVGEVLLCFVLFFCIKPLCSCRVPVQIHPCKTSLSGGVNGIPLLSIARPHCQSCFLCEEKSCRAEEWEGEMGAVVICMTDAIQQMDVPVPQPQPSKSRATGHGEEEAYMLFALITEVTEAHWGLIHTDHLIERCSRLTPFTLGSVQRKAKKGWAHEAPMTLPGPWLHTRPDFQISGVKDPQNLPDLWPKP